jgi:hypothetical protein
VLLVGGGGASAALGGQTVRLPIGTTLTSATNAPTIATQFGNANLAAIFGTPVGAQPSINDGVISIGSNTTISGITFNNTSIINHSTSNVVITNNTFTGSFTDRPTTIANLNDPSDPLNYGAINVSSRALPAIQLNNVDNLTIASNSFRYPQVQTYESQSGSNGVVCQQNGINTSVYCLSGNAIRLNNGTNATITGNTVVGALDEAFRINNPSGTFSITNNNISYMRMGPDSNIGSAIIIGQNQGSPIVEISGNSFSNNSIGIYPAVSGANQNGVLAAVAGNNVIDPIELGLCRGSNSYPRRQDLYADPNFSGNCSAPTSMTLTVARNTINLPAIGGGISQQGDGIDFNVGTNGVLNSSVFSNNIVSLGDPLTRNNPTPNIGDNGLTFDIRGSSSVILNIYSNFVGNSGDSAIKFSLQNTTLVTQPGETRITISNNTFGSSADIDRSLEIDLVNNTGLPVTQFNVTNTDQETNIGIRTRNFNPGTYYPELYYNGSLWP